MKHVDLWRTDFAVTGKRMVDAGLFRLTEQGKFLWWMPTPQLYACFSEPVDMDDALPALEALIEKGDDSGLQSLGVTAQGLESLRRLTTPAREGA